MRTATAAKTAKRNSKKTTPSASVFTIFVQGWGDNEEEMYALGVYASRKAAEAGMKEMLVQWEEDGGDADDVVWEIEENVLMA